MKSNVPVWLGDEPLIDESEISGVLETEALIAGGGMGGIVTAAFAAEAGLKTLLIEKRAGLLVVRNEMAGIGSSLQRQAGIEIDKFELIRQHCAHAAGYVDQRLLHLWADESGEVMDWYADRLRERGITLYIQGGYSAELKSGSYTRFPVGHRPLWENGLSGTKVLREYAESFGAEFRMNTALVKLEKTGNRVIGAIARDTKTGKYIRIKANCGVAVATGGYSKNREMMEALQPHSLSICAPRRGDGVSMMGDGIKACMWAGAKLDDVHTSMIFDRYPLMPDEIPATASTETHGSILLTQPFLKVNLRGDRFVNESIPYDYAPHAAMLQPGNCCCVLFDSDYMEHLEEFDMVGCSRLFPFKNGAPTSRSFTEIPAELERFVESGRFVRADTIRELGEKLNIPSDTLRATVARYNELCDRGRDEDFGKEPHRMHALRKPPFYGARSCGLLVCTIDGVRTDLNINVVDDNYDPIPGLFAVGNDAGGFYAHTYFNTVTGSNAGRMMVFARRAVRTMAGI